MNRSSPKFTHLMYADDMVIYCGATAQEAAKVTECLHKYCQCTGQDINWDKSTVHFSNNVARLDRTHLCRVLGMRECDHKGKYLGHPFCKFNSKSEVFDSIVGKVAQRLSGWKQRTLSMAGRLVLIKSVLHSIPSYIMQTFLMPNYINDKIDSKMRKFFWGFEEHDKHRLHLKAWDVVCTPKHLGGLGLRKMNDVNLAFITKLGWNLCTSLDKNWVKLVRSKYLRGRRTLDFEQTTQACSWIWGGIKRSLTLLQKGLCY